MNNKLVVLGASGMLGAMVLDVFATAGDQSIAATVRDKETAERFRGLYPEVEWRIFDAMQAVNAEIQAAIADASWVINCIGVIKPYIHDDNAAEIVRALQVNALFPHLLAQAAATQGARVLQIATDCVYSGSKGHYREGDPHDALDVYGKSKSLGEPFAAVAHSLRCSIIGPEPKSFVSLLEWFRRQPSNSSVNGFTNHQWNGVTTLHFGRLCRGIVTADIGDLPRMQHVVPTATITKCDMLRCFAEAYRRGDVTINPMEAKVVIDRTLATDNDELNARLWQAAGYELPPTVEQMIREMAAYVCRWEAA